MKKTLCAIIGSLFVTSAALAAIKTETVEYSANGVPMEGFVAYDDTVTTPRPGILIAHDWMGLGNFTKEKAQLLAKEGYVAFAVDIYGKGIRPRNADEAKTLSTKFKDDRCLLRQNMQAAFDKLKSMKEVNPNKIVVMGYCFGGTAALEFARSGAPVVGTVSFHGGLSTPTPQDAKNIKGRILALHGADDPNVPPAEVAAFQKEMKDGGVTWDFVAYKGAVHAFTDPNAGNDNSKGVAYNPEADQKSWARFEKFLKEVF